MFKLQRIFQLWRDFRHDIQLAFYLMKDPRISFFYKIPLFFAILYFIFPADLFSDFFIPGLGYIDDFMILIWATRFLVNRCPDQIKQDYVRNF